MLRSRAVSRHGPRSRATTSSPSSVSSLARMAPLHPSPITTTSVRRSFVGTTSPLQGPVGAPHQADRRQRVLHVVLLDVIAKIVAYAGKADHLPSDHVEKHNVKYPLPPVGLMG